MKKNDEENSGKGRTFYAHLSTELISRNDYSPKQSAHIPSEIFYVILHRTREPCPGMHMGNTNGSAILNKRTLLDMS